MVEKSPNALSVLTRAWRSLQLGNREMDVLDADALGALPDVDEPVLIAVDQRLQQHAADDAEDGGVGADAKRERQDDRECQALDPHQRPPRESQIGKEIHRHTRPPLLTSRTRPSEIDVPPRRTAKPKDYPHGPRNTPAYFGERRQELLEAVVGLGRAGFHPGLEHGVPCLDRFHSAGVRQRRLAVALGERVGLIGDGAGHSLEFECLDDALWRDDLTGTRPGTHIPGPFPFG